MKRTHGQPCSAPRSARSSVPTLGREYHLSVALPDSYGKSTQAYPVIYVLDGDIFFGMAAGLTPLNSWFSAAPEAIIVGIGYGMASYEQWVQLRERDFKIPEVRDAPPDAAANVFLDCPDGGDDPFY